ncbi:exo-alpha-sialidase [Pseudoxanthomonas putridarboris]|uniref:Exo-alpha-sialidase n=1 Tax=Pseudoxanthomonas putridarboris TaxID=752605 RepID=A0ABU9J243_9GAMM
MIQPTPSRGWMLAAALLTAAASALGADGDVRGEHLAAGVGYASAVQLAHQPRAADNGRMLLVFEPSEPGGIPLYESRDEGARWRRVGEVVDQPHGDTRRWQLRWQPHLSELARSSGDLPAGTLLLAANSTGRNEQNQVVRQDLQLYASRDGGQRWEYRGSIVEGGGQPSDRLNQGVWEPYIVVLDDGRMVAYYSSEQHKQDGYNQLLAHKVSADGGRTWGQEAVDVAFPGGVERPGMAIVERIGDRGYAMVFENIDGERNGQVHLKLSRDGLDWGKPEDPGIAIRTASGAWPAACPSIRWLPGETVHGVLLVAAQRAGGGGDADGRTFYRNDNGGEGPWWEVAAPVAKRSGNIHAGWTQAMLPRRDGTLLHITSSSTANAPADAEANEILHAAAPLALHRYEAEDAHRRRGAQINDDDASAGRKVRLASGSGADLAFEVQADRAGERRLRVRYADIGFAAAPRLEVNGRALPAAEQPVMQPGWRTAEFLAPMQAGANRIVVTNASRPLDYDYLEIDPVAP